MESDNCPEEKLACGRYGDSRGGGLGLNWSRTMNEDA
jgi:hypothetical protein